MLRVQLNPLPATLQQVADLLNKIDLQNRQWAAESGRAQRPANTPNPKEPLAPVVPVSQRTTTNPAWKGPAPMELSVNNRSAARNATRATKRAKAMAEGLCFTCASPDHTRANCPVQAEYDQARTLRAAATDGAEGTPAAGPAAVAAAPAPSAPQPAKN